MKVLWGEGKRGLDLWELGVGRENRSQASCFISFWNTGTGSFPSAELPRPQPGTPKSTITVLSRVIVP
jgi:hypothetical protein